MSYKENKLRKILISNLVAPVLKLKETHPDHFFTEKGYKMLVDNTIEDILKLYERK